MLGMIRPRVPRRALGPPFLAVLLSAAAFLPWGARPAAAQAYGCPTFERAQVKFDVTMAPLKHDYDKSVAQLAAMPGRAPGPRGAAHGHILGLAHSSYEHRYSMNARFAPQRGGVFCGALATVTVSIGLSERTVMVAKELPRGTCIHREVLAHEMKHVAVDEKLLKDFIPIAKRRVEDAVARMGTVRARGQEQVMTQLRRPLDAVLKETMQDFSRERQKRQAQVDTMQEYERVTRSCDGEVRKYVKDRRLS